MKDFIQSFIDCMAENGIVTDDPIIGDGRLHRIHIKGHSHGSKNAAYKLNLDGIKPAGYFEDFKAGIRGTWKADGPIRPMTTEERHRHEAKRQRIEAAQKVKHDQAIQTARRYWQQGRPVHTQNEHPYLIDKGIQPHGVRLLDCFQKRIKTPENKWQTLSLKQVLLIPMVNFKNEIGALQLIFAKKIPELNDRNKDFLAGCRVDGLFAYIGQTTTPEKIICEGFATGATLHEATGYQVFCAMSKGNLKAVAQLIRQNRPQAKIIIAADNDDKPGGNPGVEAATEAARAVGGLLCVSPIGDFNDFAQVKVV